MFNFRILAILIVGFNSHSFGQSFDWAEDGYKANSHGGKYYNVDDSGIDLQVVGLYRDRSFKGQSTVKTGIINNVKGGVVHQYQFIFSEKVNLKFSIHDINFDTTTLCFFDYLRFSHQATFSNVSGVDIIADSMVTPLKNGAVTLKFNEIDTLTIWHGMGRGCNPGFIGISPLVFSGSSKISEEKTKEKFKNILFDSAESRLGSSATKQLDLLLTFLEVNSSSKIKIKGFTDNVGDESANLQLSTTRVQAVVDYLLSKRIKLNRLIIQENGESKPTESNATIEGRALNRRVEIEVVEAP
ncbi:MAG: outer membrane protein OmpA-like peptidoglycan-associated protein [Arenicella sp.]|jgi:outer membrane protein OmpA-like peptidoglycan-associated protein